MSFSNHDDGGFSCRVINSCELYLFSIFFPLFLDFAFATVCGDNLTRTKPFCVRTHVRISSTNRFLFSLFARDNIVSMIDGHFVIFSRPLLKRSEKKRAKTKNTLTILICWQ